MHFPISATPPTQQQLDAGRHALLDDLVRLRRPIRYAAIGMVAACALRLPGLLGVAQEGEVSTYWLSNAVFYFAMILVPNSPLPFMTPAMRRNRLVHGLGAAWFAAMTWAIWKTGNPLHSADVWLGLAVAVLVAAWSIRNARRTARVLDDLSELSPIADEAAPSDVLALRRVHPRVDAYLRLVWQQGRKLTHGEVRALRAFAEPASAGAPADQTTSAAT